MKSTSKKYNHRSTDHWSSQIITVTDNWCNVMYHEDFKFSMSSQTVRLKVHPEKSRIINSIFWAILDIEGFPFFLGDVWGSWGASGPAWGFGRNLYPK